MDLFVSSKLSLLKIFLFQFVANFSVEEYNPEKDEWRIVAPMNVKRSRVALCANMGKLWAIGGYDGESNLSTVRDILLLK